MNNPFSLEGKATLVASIPLTIVTEMKEILGPEGRKKILSTAIGGGFSLASTMFYVGQIHCSDLVIVKDILENF